LAILKLRAVKQSLAEWGTRLFMGTLVFVLPTSFLERGNKFGDNYKGGLGLIKGGKLCPIYKGGNFAPLRGPHMGGRSVSTTGGASFKGGPEISLTWGPPHPVVGYYPRRANRLVWCGDNFVPPEGANVFY